MLVKHLSLRVSHLESSKRSACTQTVFKPEKDILSILPGKITNYDLSNKEYLTLRNLQNDRSVAIKQADKGSRVVVWNRTDYLKEADRQLSDEKTYEEIRITESWWKNVTNCFLT